MLQVLGPKLTSPLSTDDTCWSELGRTSGLVNKKQTLDQSLSLSVRLLHGEPSQSFVTQTTFNQVVLCVLWTCCLPAPSAPSSEIPSLQDQARGDRLQQPSHQTGWESHHPGDLLPAARPQSSGRELHVRTISLQLRSVPWPP